VEKFNQSARVERGFDKSRKRGDPEGEMQKNSGLPRPYARTVDNLERKNKNSHAGGGLQTRESRDRLAEERGPQ